ncbi:O-6-methylguanine DNA methyltransferase [Rhodoligotrophos appendicifer]|uniref:methylated-DNA--[protein]-cysteine S-methyltransferase n=1 Tax=Rhodoligotrophos appendicifer TaxID=987056 RepID=UPI001960E61F|nr:methylated-DNA--[protein]-cysteine S-methyltransferase [Rhodoligotrophos appendicifer]
MTGVFVVSESFVSEDRRERGATLAMQYGYHPSPFGDVLLMTAGSSITGLGFADSEQRADALLDMTRRWPAADFVEDSEYTAGFIDRIFEPGSWTADEPLSLLLIGTGFQLKVWQRLLAIPFGRTTTYSSIAHELSSPTATRAVGTAVGRNPISMLVPCHRVLGRSGNLCGYHWGLERKQSILAWERQIASRGSL